MSEKPIMSMLVTQNDTAGNPIVEINESGGSLTGDSAKLHANGVAIEPGPAVGKPRCPECGGTDFRLIMQSSSYDYNCKQCGCFFSTKTGFVDFPIGDPRSKEPGPAVDKNAVGFSKCMYPRGHTDECPKIYEGTIKDYEYCKFRGEAQGSCMHPTRTVGEGSPDGGVSLSSGCVDGLHFEPTHGGQRVSRADVAWETATVSPNVPLSEQSAKMLEQGMEDFREGRTRRVGTIAGLAEDIIALGREVPMKEWQLDRLILLILKVCTNDATDLLDALRILFQEQAAELSVMKLRAKQSEALTLLEERNEFGLTDMACAMDAILDAGCDCGSDEPGTCLGCVCKAALMTERKRAEKAEAERDAALKDLSEMENAWQLAYAGRACPKCGKWVTMNNDPELDKFIENLDRLEKMEEK